MKKKQVVLKRLFMPIGSVVLLLAAVLVLLTGGISQAAQSNNEQLTLVPTHGAPSGEQETEVPSIVTDEASTPAAEVTEEVLTATPETTDEAAVVTDESPEGTEEATDVTSEVTVEVPSNVSTPLPPSPNEPLIAVFADNNWSVGNTVFLCQGTEIREGPDSDFTVHTVVPENDWAVVVKGGPTQANGYTWWDIDRGAAGDPSGGTGWVRQDQADCGDPDPGGDDNSTPGNNIWQVGNDAYLCQGTQIRQGPGLSSTVHTVVPENDWKVVIKGGPTSADGYTWWDIDRGAAGDPSGGTGWVRQDQADCDAPGGDNSTPGNNIWQVGNDAYLCQGTQIRQGPGLSSTVHTVVPENDWKVVIKGGPTQADGFTWWDIDRGAAGDPSGGTGWVRQDQADCDAPGGDNSTPGNNIWQVGNDAYLCQGTQIRQGAGLSFSVHTVVPENDWHVKIKGGPTSADGYTWWDIDRAAAGDPSGGTGWVRQDQADCDAPGGDDNSTTEQNIWRVGNDAYLCQGTEIRQGPGISFSVHTVVPENDWKVGIIGGPTQANGLTWWDVSRAAVGDPSGGSGWVIQLQADCQPFTPIPDLTETVVPPTSPAPPTSPPHDQGSPVLPGQVTPEPDNSSVTGGFLRTDGTVNIHVRRGPGIEYASLGLIPANSVYEILDYSPNNWYKILFNGLEGWVSGDLVDRIASPVQTLRNVNEVCRIGATSRYLSSSNITVNLRERILAIGGIPFFEHNWVLRIPLPDGSLTSIRRIERNSRDATQQINLNATEVLGASDTYMDFWIDGSWALRNLPFRDETSWTVYYNCN